MPDDFSETTLDREAMTFDDPLAEPSAPGASGMPVTPAVPGGRAAPGPAWAGTLARAPVALGEPVPPPLLVEPSTPPAVQVPPEADDPTDLAATSLHQRAYDVEVAPPLDELSEHNRILAALPGRTSPSQGPTEAGDLALKIGLVLVIAAIVVLVLVLLGTAAAALLGAA